jgi:outer membrane receptor protein involved in Fe transport
MAKVDVFAFCILEFALVALPPARAAELLPASLLPAGSPAPESRSADAALDPIVVKARRLMELPAKSQEFDESRDQDLLPKLGATQYTIDKEALQALPQGTNTPLDKVLLQIPGISYDSAISNPDFHVRNEYANVQYRINGIQLPDGVSALGPVLETGFIGNLNLLDGALPAQYGLRTAGVVDITTKSAFDPGGNLDLYAGSWATVSPSVEYGGGVGETQYFLTGRYLLSNQGLENATPMENPIHDRTTQEKLFGYGSTLFGDSSRLTYMTGAFVGHFQIPNVEGQEPLGDFGPASLSSTRLNENEKDRFFFGVVALQTHHDGLDTQISLFTRYATVDFVPDVYGDLAFNDVASNVVRKSLLNGLQFDAVDRVSDAHTLRAGLTASIEKTQVQDLAAVLPLDADGNPLPTPLTLNDYTSKVGWIAGVYAQDEWRMRPDLTLNTGVRFDQMNQFVSANQVSPRIAVIYKPVAHNLCMPVYRAISRRPCRRKRRRTTSRCFKTRCNSRRFPSMTRFDPSGPRISMSA